MISYAFGKPPAQFTDGWCGLCRRGDVGRPRGAEILVMGEGLLDEMLLDDVAGEARSGG